MTFNFRISGLRIFERFDAHISREDCAVFNSREVVFSQLSYKIPRGTVKKLCSTDAREITVQTPNVVISCAEHLISTLIAGSLRRTFPPLGRRRIPDTLKEAKGAGTHGVLSLLFFALASTLCFVSKFSAVQRKVEACVRPRHLHQNKVVLLFSCKER